MQDDISGWSEWYRNFSSIEEISSPSELHGLLTGIVCVTQAPTSDEWVQILETLDVPELNPEALELLTGEAEDIFHALSEDALDYLPLLPDDEHSLAERVQALADWCAGVVLGFGLASGHIRNDEMELIEHLQDVAAVEFENSDDDAEGEESYQELYEFVRLIPVSLSVGRKKVEVEETPLLQKFTQKAPVPASATEAQSVVEIFSPKRPS
ncbi:MAG TPA: YecA family protein [Acinetobacter sp.]|nr:YecA family protein [Acinetobacter sp.]